MAEAHTLNAGDLHFRRDLQIHATKGELAWKTIARQTGPRALPVNFSTLFHRDSFENPGILEFAGADNAMINYVASQLADCDAIARRRQFPYRYLAAYLNASNAVPSKIKPALHDAAEIACRKLPVVKYGKTAARMPIGIQISNMTKQERAV